MRTEQQALKVSLVAVLILSALGITFGVLSGSAAIIFDGVFSLLDAVMSILAITLAGLIARSTTNRLSERTRRRFTMGFWHFEPLLLMVNAVLMISVAVYAMAEAVAALLSGGREIEFGPAVGYAAIVLVLTAAVGYAEHRANRRLDSALVAMDVKGWLMAGGVTGALLVAFLIGMLLEGTGAEHLMPYVDPVVLLVVAGVLIPVPLPVLRRAVAEMALVTPPELRAEAEDLAAEVAEAEGFVDHRVYVAQVGRARQVEMIFHAAPGGPARPLEHWDRIRADVRRRLSDDDPNHWITVAFTTTPRERSAAVGT
ncbi:MAG: cation transporter [Nesterenkonia sp.]|uniref:cation diffusion facilitator family transporter n=1 Tax=Nesterenkonia marinintestina TaxID=2979865 RepID=UPI0021C0EFEF|nr:cation transporter [Nesterenkonia sp. GX14115]MDO5492803.1 cation transporter [Nesterenkonia sp.]